MAKPTNEIPLFEEMTISELPRVSSTPQAGERCKCCDSEIANGDAYDVHGEIRCTDCCAYCEGCDEHQDIDDVRETRHTVRGRTTKEYRCKECSFECHDCEEIWGNDEDDYENDSGRRICRSCAENYYSCEGCGCLVHVDYSHSNDEGQTFCEGCYREDEDKDEDDGLIHSYGYKPAPLFTYGKGEKVDSKAMFLGIEIEVENMGGYSCERCLVGSGVLDNPKFYIKKDRSVFDGFEIVSHPLTWSAWKEEKLEFLTKLKIAGCRSYNTTTCGMHVHVSRESLSPLNRFKLLMFFRDNAHFIKWASKREAENLDKWAKVIGDPYWMVSRKASGRDVSNRYEAINLCPDKTIEFRIFRGTLSISGVRRNIALIVALCLFVKQSPTHGFTLVKFMGWIRGSGRLLVGKREADSLIKWLSAYKGEI